jgi:hypothetical protein
MDETSKRIFKHFFLKRGTVSWIFHNNSLVNDISSHLPQSTWSNDKIKF